MRYAQRRIVEAGKGLKLTSVSESAVSAIDLSRNPKKHLKLKPVDSVGTQFICDSNSIVTTRCHGIRGRVASCYGCDLCRREVWFRLGRIRGRPPFYRGYQSLFIGLGQSKDAAIQSTTTFPLGFSVTFVFLLFYAFPDNLMFWRRLGIAIMLWLLVSAVLTILIVFSGFSDFYLSVVAYAVISLTVYYALNGRRINDAQGGKTELTEPVKSQSQVKPSKGYALSFRRSASKGTLRGFVVAAVVVISAYGGPLAGGVAGSAPAIWTSSLIVTRPDFENRDMGFSRSLAKSFLKVGVVTIIPFYVAVRYILATVHTGWGSTTDVGLSILLAYAAISPLVAVVWHRTHLSMEH